MSELSKLSCVLVGGQSLLIKCAELLLEKKYSIVAILSDEEPIQEWASKHNINSYSVTKVNLKKLEESSFDYLFSIANLKILPKNFIKAPKKLAINYHDGPLPHYAGINVPSWAIINNEKEHAINWHVMTEEVDKGDILVSMPVSIVSDESSVSLNTKCFEAGINGFEKLLLDIDGNSISFQKQDLDGFNSFDKCKRPTAVSTLFWAQPAKKIDALIRALNFGEYWNPIGLPKLFLSDLVVIVKKVTITEDESSAQPGTVISVENGLRVATVTYDLVLTDFLLLNGDSITPENLLKKTDISVGDVLPSISENQQQNLTKLDFQSCKYEKNWIERIKNITPLEIPYLQSSSSSNDTFSDSIQAQETFEQFVNLFSEETGDKLAQALLLYLSKLCQKEELSVAFNDVVNAENNECIHYFEQKLPLNITINKNISLSEYFSEMDEKFIEHRKLGVFSRDLVLRTPELRPGEYGQKISTLTVGLYRATDAFEFHSGLTCDLNIIISDDGRQSVWRFNDKSLSKESIQCMQEQFSILLKNIVSDLDNQARNLSILTESDQNKLIEWNQTDLDFNRAVCIHKLFEEQVTKTPGAVALTFNGQDFSYSEVNSKANKIAHLLIELGVKPDNLVGILIDRSDEMVVAMLAVLKSGAAYIPLDPAYPDERIIYMLHDSGAAALISQKAHASKFSEIQNTILIDDYTDDFQRQPDINPTTDVRSDNLAYTIYTSGSTGKPKGVMVSHENVINFFVGMDQRVGNEKTGVWLAVTSISFDISVLELFWTLTRGYQVVLYKDEQRDSSRNVQSKYPDREMLFSLFYWNVAEEKNKHDDDKYRLLIESVKFGDKHGFSAVWTPERHFHSFGGLYPNPSVTSAALATITENIQIRAGSCVLPLHHPIRVAEEWAMVDNFSNGRVGIAIAAGWQPNDFVIMPQNHADAKKIMFESAEQVQKLWRGEELEFPGPDGNSVSVQTLPRPIQKELPIWVTTAGNPETFRQAGEFGANVLTHLLGQSVEDVAKNLKIYREAYKSAGHDGEGKVTLLLHTLVGTDTKQIKEIARKPMKNYLKSAMFLVKAAAWHFPTFKELSSETGKTLDDYFSSISDEDMDALLEFAYERYFTTSGLFGTPEICMEIVDELKGIGVNEIGCLIDYGIDTDTVLKFLPNLNELRQFAAKSKQGQTTENASIPELIKRYNVTHFQCTPSMASMLLNQPEAKQALASLRYMMVGGEALPPVLAKELTELLEGKLVNMYGPTETTIWSTTHEITEGSRVYIGKPIVNTYIYVLDPDRNPVPIGVPGELYIGGYGVTRGYLKRPELTSERYIKNTFHYEKNHRIYKTGDLVRFRSDGVLEYIGRTDFQVKMRGYRIELGEIEARLGQSPHVHEAVVIVREDNPGDQRLVAYVVAKSEHVIQPEHLRSMLRENLPEHMVPAHIVELQRLPLTPNGKIERKALPSPGLEQLTTEQLSESPTNDVEEIVYSLWDEILGVQGIGIHDNFFDLGGHSLLATQLIARLRKLFHTELPLHAIFDTPTIAGLSKALVKAEEQTGKIKKIATALIEHKRLGGEEEINDSELVAVLNGQGVETSTVDLVINKFPFTDRPPLSYGQQRLWFLDKLEPGSHYNDAFVLNLQGVLDLNTFEQSINKVISRHEVLRTVFATSEGEPYQVIDPDLTIKVKYTVLSDEPEGRRINIAKKLMTEEIQRPTDLAVGPVLRVTLYDLGDNEYLFLLVIHQVANDSWSIGVFMDELWKIYQSFIENQPLPVSDLQIQYSDYAQWQRRYYESGTLDKELAYWQDKLSGELPIIDLPADYPRPPTQNFHGARYFVELSNELVVKLKNISTQLGCTPFILLLTVFKLLLLRYTGQTDIIVGAPIANRDRQELAPLLGMFINNLVLRSDFSGNPSFKEVLSKVLITTTEAYDHPNVSFERLVEVLQPERDLSRTPLFQVMFDYQNTPLNLPDLPGLRMQKENVDGKYSRFDLTLELSELENGIKGHWEYNTELFSEARIERMSSHFINLLNNALDKPENHLFDLPLMSDEEREQIIIDWNNTEASYPSGLGIHQLFEKQVDLTPDKPALIMGGKTMSYAQLNEEANRLAKHLNLKAINNVVPIGICVERSFDMVISMLAVLKAGAAYLPLDPAYPEDRIAYMLQDSQTALVIAGEELCQRFTDLGVDTISPSEPFEASEANLELNICSDDLAYIIYTSGSTGKPKGVEVPHRTAVNFLCSMQQKPGIKDSDVLLAVTTICFDISVLEIFLPLISGSSVVIVDKETTMDGNLLLNTINEHNVTLMQATPATWRILLATGWQGSTKLKALCGGEALPAELIKELVPCVASLWNMYGPTETTVWSSCYEIKTPDDLPLIGQPISNTNIYILDEYMQPVPIGVPGEVYIGGDGVVRGYHNRPELTAERFVKNPFAISEETFLYKTGDLARFNDNGNIEYIQRIDNQVKVRGFRIELGEIETCLVGHSAIKQAVVNVHEERPGDKRLVAYIIYESSQHVTVSELRKYLKGLLPDYMVPAMYIDIHEFPLTPSGKVDRKALPSPFRQDASQDNYVQPRNQNETTLANIWKNVLHIERVGVHDNFFDLGGHSLLSIQVIAQIEKTLGVKVNPRAMVMDTLEQIAVTFPEIDEKTSFDGSENAIESNKSQSIFDKMLKLFDRKKSSIDE